MALEDARPRQVEGQVEAGLAADRRQQRIGTLRRDDLLQHLDRHGLDVRSVGELRIGHDGGRVRVHQDHPVPLLAEGLARLRTGIVELARLADDHRPGADQEDRVHVAAPRHASDAPSGR
jgi:hypothetical protein